MFCKIILRNKFGLLLETLFSYTGAQETLWTKLPLPNLKDKLQRDQESSCYIIKIKTMNITSVKEISETFVLNKDGKLSGQHSS